MKREFMHFTNFAKEPEPSIDKTLEELADEIEYQIRKMMEDGDSHAEIRIDVPDNLTPDEAAQFIESVMKRFYDEEDDE